MTIDIEQLEIDLNALIMQTERENAEFTRQLYIQRKIHDVTKALLRSNADALTMVVDHMRALTARSIEDAPPQEIAQRFSPEYPGAQAIGRLANGHGAH